jgi:hypothetical protein
MARLDWRRFDKENRWMNKEYISHDYKNLETRLSEIERGLLGNVEVSTAVSYQEQLSLLRMREQLKRVYIFKALQA